MNEPSQFIVQVAKTGKKHTGVPALNMCDPIAHFFLPNGKLDYSKLDKRDGSCTRRELLARILLLYAVVSQFDDNYHLSSNEATKALYLREIRFLHRPIEFYQSQGIIIDEVLEKHRNFGFLKPENWGSPYTENRFIDKTSHALNSGTSFWKVPLALPLLLERDSTEKRNNTTALIDFLEFWSSTEEMCLQLKAHPRYGLGKAIGDKACHLFAKWMISSFRLTRKNELSWDEFSYEAPYDSNAGRVLWRTGYLLQWATEKEYIKANVVQPGAGKQGLNYLRVTNIRGVGASTALPENIQSRYGEIAVNHLKSNRRPPRKVEIQRIQHAYLLERYEEVGLSVADFDEGLIYIGTNFCFNHDKPNCRRCPIKKYCEGTKSKPKLIANYRT